MEDLEIREFPKRIPEKLKIIREHFNMTAEEFAPLVQVNDGAEIEPYERDLGSDVEGGLLVTTLWRYARVARVRMEDLIEDGRDILAEERKAHLAFKTGEYSKWIVSDLPLLLNLYFAWSK